MSNEFLNIKTKYSCKRTGICCRSATAVKPWEKLAKAKENHLLRDFFNIFIPYETSDEYKKLFPDAYNECIKIANTRDDINISNIYFYHCRFFKEPNICQIYEDRPDLCRNYPDSPYDSIDPACGYYNWSKECKKFHINLKYELENLKKIEFSNYIFFISSPVLHWLR